METETGKTSFIPETGEMKLHWPTENLVGLVGSDDVIKSVRKWLTWDDNVGKACERSMKVRVKAREVSFSWRPSTAQRSYHMRNRLFTHGKYSSR